MDYDKEPTQKQIREIKASLEKQHGREFTQDEVIKAINKIKHLAEVSYGMIEEQVRREKLLKGKPKGILWEEEVGACEICGEGEGNAAGNLWLDKYGLKCMRCQKGVNAKIIPGSVIKKRDSWYSRVELETYFNIKGADLTKYLKQSVLKDRFVKGEKRKKHFQLFLIKDNKDVLPPKNLLKPRIAKVDRNGEEFFTTENWYEYADKKLIKKLAKYKIIHCLKETLSKPIETGSFLWKEAYHPFAPKFP